MRRFLAFLAAVFVTVWGFPALGQSTSAGITPCGAGITLSATSVTSNSILSVCGGTAVVWNLGPAEVFLNLGAASNTAATTSGWSVPAGGSLSLSTGRAPLYLAAITASSTSTLRVIQGNGAPMMGAAGGGSAGGAFPSGSTPITASATGTTGATTATLAGVAGKTTYICGFSIRANATAAATANATVTGTITATMNFTQWTAPLASGIGLVEQTFTPCVPASAVNTGIAVVSAAPGSGGVVSSTAWGYQQ